MTPDGTQLWTARYDGPSRSDYPLAVKLDESGNAYVAGSSKGDYLMVKYDRNGNQLWTARYDGPSHDVDGARGLAIDNIGNVIVTGSSRSASSRDPRESGFDFATVKYDTNGQQLWARRYGDLNRLDEGAIAVTL